MSATNTPLRPTPEAPCCREECGLAEVHRRLTLAARAHVDDDFELILVDDGSPGGDWAGICVLGDARPRVVNHGHQTNSGT